MLLQDKSFAAERRFDAPDALGGEAGSIFPPYDVDPNAPREKVPEAYRWSLSNLFEDVASWEQARDHISERLGEIGLWKGRVASSAKALEGCLDLVFQIALEIDRLSAFARLDYYTDRTRPEAKIRNEQAETLVTRFREATAFLEPELLATDPRRLRRFLASSPGLKKYTHYIEDLIRRKAHVLSPDSERVLAMTGDLRTAVRFVLSALEEDVKFPPVKDKDGREWALTRSSFPKLRRDPDRALRREATEKFFSTLGAFGRSFAAVLELTVKGNVLEARARGYKSALEAALDRNAIPVAVYDTLIEVVESHLPQTLHRYVALRKRIMGLDEVHYYDLYAPLFPSPLIKVPYPEAVRLVEEAMGVLGQEYLRMLAEGLDPRNRWVDVFPNAGKRGGAFCSGTYGTEPRVFLNFMGEIDDVFTLAHEFGHAMHFKLSFEAQEYVNAEAPIFLAEIASTFHEELLLNHLLEKAKGTDERLFLLSKRLENIRGTVFRQVMFAAFERAVYEMVESGAGITAEGLGDLYAEMVKRYYGEDFTIDEHDRWEWAYIPHFHYNFYVYQYATGLMSAVALSRAVLEEGGAAVERYLGLLKAGGSDYPLELLRRAGVDLTRPEPMLATIALFEETLEEMEALWEASRRG